MLCCPSCDVKLEEMPKARRKCPNCKEWIYVKKPFKAGKKVIAKILMTKAQADKTDEEYRKFKELESCGGLTLDKWLAKKMTEAAYDLKSKNIARARDTYLEILGKVKDKKMRYSAHTGFCKSQLFIYESESETNYVHVNKASNTNLSCFEKTTSNTQLITIKSALKKMPIPCNSELCGCYYTHVFKEDLPKKRAWWKLF